MHTQQSSGGFYRNRRIKTNRPKKLCPWNGSDLLWSSLFCRCNFTQVFCIWLTPLASPIWRCSKKCKKNKKYTKPKKKNIQLMEITVWQRSSLTPIFLKCKGRKLKATASKCIQHCAKWRKRCHRFDGVYWLFLCRNGTLGEEIWVSGGGAV